MKKNSMLPFGIAALIILGAPMACWAYYRATYVPPTPPGPSIYDEFATCIKDSGTKFYGTFWCPHCAAQKELFGTSATLLPYIECSTSNSKGQLQVCRDANITSYPTWEFADGSRVTGVQQLATLAEKTSCTLP